MKIKPRWLATEKPNQVAMIIRNKANYDDCEVFNVELRDKFNKTIFQGCVEAAMKITESLDEGIEYINRFYYFNTETQCVSINIPPVQRARKMVKTKLEEKDVR